MPRPPACTFEKELRDGYGAVTRQAVQTLDMNDTQVALTTINAASKTQLSGNIIFADPNSAGASEDLLLPPEAECTGMALDIVNTGGESIVVKEDGDSTTIVTIATAKGARVVCDGTTWRSTALVA